MKMKMKKMRKRLAVIAAFLCAVCVPLLAQDAYRTDASTDESLPWFQLKPGEYPPPNSAHHIAGELISLDHLNRTGVIRADRTDAQRRGDWDQGLPFTMLPYGAIWYHGAPAELRHIPIGTHLHGQFYLRPMGPKDKRDARPGIEVDFNRVLLLEDDFSFNQREKKLWKVESVDLDLATLVLNRAGDPKPGTFLLLPQCRVWKGHCIGALSDIAPGQEIAMNITYATLKGPGRPVDLWLDQEARDLAAQQQREIHRQYMLDHGAAGWVEDVDNQKAIMTVGVFDLFDHALLDDFVEGEPVVACVAEENLRTYDQINDRKRGTLLEKQIVPARPGYTGVRLKLQLELLLEGFRPGRVVRVWPGRWKLDDLPREEHHPE
jgi:hypothetical protein